ncbi:MAG: hypothetical protein U1F13_03270 [Acinetobacter parvus]
MASWCVWNVQASLKRLMSSLCTKLLLTVDLNVNVEEQHSGTTTLAVGYSQNGGVTFRAGLSQTNFMGTGNRVAIDFTSLVQKHRITIISV